MPFRWSLIALGGMALLAACTSGDSSPTGAPSPTAEPSIEATASPTPTPLAVTTPVPTRVPAALELVPLITPTPGPPVVGADGLPQGALGPLVVYRRTVELNSSTGLRHYEVVTHDAGGGGDVSVFPVGGTSVRVVLSGRRILVNFGRVLHSYALDGTDRVVLWDGTTDDYIENVRPSPDGALVAINVVCEPPEDCPGFELPNHVYVVDAATGEQFTHIEQTADLPEDFYGIAAPIGWRDDGSVALGGHFHRGGGGGDAAVLGLDGNLTVIRDDPDRGTSSAWNRALGRPQPLFAGGNVFCGVMGFPGVTRIALTSAETGAELNAIEADAPVLAFYGFGPGGWGREWDEVLVRELLIDHEERAAWRQQVAQGECPGEPWDFTREDPEQWWLLPIDGGEPRRVESQLEARREWDGDRLVTYVCGGMEVLDSSELRRRLGDPCNARRVEVELRVGGVTVATALDPEFIGFVEIDAPSGAP